VAVVLSLTVVVTLSRVTFSNGGVGKLKCYDIKGGIEKACFKRSSLNVSLSARRTPRGLKAPKRVVLRNKMRVGLRP
jgi:hypothetical protein